MDDSRKVELGETGMARDERVEIAARTAVSALIVHEAIRLEGEEELQRPPEALAFSGLAAGLSMGFSFVAEGTLNYFLPDTGWAPLLIKLGYPVGFLIVILGRQQLFTETTVTVVLPLFARRSLTLLLQVLRFWGIVLVTNLLGALAFAWILGATDVYGEAVKSQLAQLAQATLFGDFWSVVLRGIFAGWLIATVVWLMPAAGSMRLWVIVILTYVVGLANLSHIIAGSVETLFLVTTGRLGWSTWITTFMVPTLLGNAIGGVALVSALNYGQVAAGRTRRRRGAARQRGAAGR
jgi:formate/nitrite transporter FocA (FNT family)